MIEELFKTPVYTQKLKLNLKTIETFCTNLSLEDKGKTLSLKDVLACNVDNKDYIGSPYLNNVEVKIEILENKKDKKVLVFKKRRKIGRAHV